MGTMGLIMYISIFFIRPVVLIPSTLLFIAGGLAFGPFLGPLFGLTPQGFCLWILR